MADPVGSLVFLECEQLNFDGFSVRVLAALSQVVLSCAPSPVDVDSTATKASCTVQLLLERGRGLIA